MTNQNQNQNKISKNYAFIDSQNLNLGVKSSGWKLDYKKFRLSVEMKKTSIGDRSKP